MGGFYNAIADVAGETAEKVAGVFSKKFAPKVGESVEMGMYKQVLHPDRVFESHPAGKALLDLHYNDYIPLREKKISALVNTPQQQMSPGEIYRQASEEASRSVYGPRRHVIQGVLKAVARDKGQNYADAMADHYHILFQEAMPQIGNTRTTSFIKDMAHSTGGEEGINVPNSPYRPVNTGERVNRAVSRFLAYKAAPLHASAAVLNSLSKDGIVNFARNVAEIWGPGRQAAEARILASNTISELYMQGYREKYYFNQSKIAKFAPNGAGEFLHRNMHIPGINMVRYESLLMGANAGKLMAEEAAAKLKYAYDFANKNLKDGEIAMAKLASGSYITSQHRWAKTAFRSMNIDPMKIASQNFKLLPEDLEKAFHHGANQRVFLDPHDSTPTFWRSSPLWRSVKTFTGFISKQGQFEKDLLIHQFKSGDFIGIARNIALKTMLYPLVGATITELDRLATFNDWDDPAEHYGNRLDATPAGQLEALITGRNSAASKAKVTLNSLDMLARLSAFGAGVGYLRGTNRANLAQHILPPTMNMGIQLIQDLDKAKNYDAQHPHAADALGRDVLSDIPSYGLGDVWAKQEFPTATERNKGKFKKFRYQKPKADTWNPFNQKPYDF